MYLAPYVIGCTTEASAACKTHQTDFHRLTTAKDQFLAFIVIIGDSWLAMN